jgi:hypothetical protein
MDAVLADLVAGCGYDAPTLDPADDEWLSREARIVVHFDGRIERIHIDVEYRAAHGN